MSNSLCGVSFYLWLNTVAQANPTTHHGCLGGANQEAAHSQASPNSDYPNLISAELSSIQFLLGVLIYPKGIIKTPVCLYLFAVGFHPFDNKCSLHRKTRPMAAGRRVWWVCRAAKSDRPLSVDFVIGLMSNIWQIILLNSLSHLNIHSR